MESKIDYFDDFKLFMTQMSIRNTIRDAAFELLRDADAPMHYLVIAQRILPALGLAGAVREKVVNDSLHEDPKFRFVRTGRGEWSLRKTPLFVR